MTTESSPALPPARIRPGSVTALVVLMWLGVAFTLIAAVVLFIAGAGIASMSVMEIEARLVKDFGVTLANAERLAPAIGPVMLVSGGVLILAAIVQALLAVFISKGSNVARILLTIIMVLRILSVVATMFQGLGSGIVAYVIIELAFDILILALMYNRAANEFFTDRVS